MDAWLRALAMAVAPAAANGDDDNKISTHLIGYRETPLTSS
jgi:hypothetical protein